MTTWKTRLAVSRNANDESEVDDSLLNAGLFTYPILQSNTCAGLRGPAIEQHLELTRDLAEIFNRTYPSPTPLFQVLELILRLVAASEVSGFGGRGCEACDYEGSGHADLT